jgi:REP element-mobilizing transposase RayT
VHEDGKDFALHAFVIMPNHVHALLSLGEETSLSDVMKGWKRVSAHRINELTSGSGPV